jgi:hypothetical protein
MPKIRDMRARRVPRCSAQRASCLCAARRCFPQAMFGIKAAQPSARNRLLLFSISVLFCSVLFCSILFCSAGLSVGCWPRNGVFQWDAGPGMGSFSGMLAQERGLSVGCWPRNGVFLCTSSGMLAQEWGLSVECWPRNGVF